MTSESLLKCYRDEVNDNAIANNDTSIYRINSNKTIASRYFEYKTKIIKKHTS